MFAPADARLAQAKAERAGVSQTRRAYVRQRTACGKVCRLKSATVRTASTAATRKSPLKRGLRDGDRFGLTKFYILAIMS